MVDNVYNFPDSRVPRRSDRTEGGGPPHDQEMRLIERIAKLEARVDKLFWAISLGLSALIAIAIFQFQSVESQIDSTEGRLNSRMDRIETKVDALPSQLTDIANAISSSITATKQQPIIINIPNEAEERPQ